MGSHQTAFLGRTAKAVRDKASFGILRHRIFAMSSTLDVGTIQEQEPAFDEDYQSAVAAADGEF